MISTGSRVTEEVTPAAGLTSSAPGGNGRPAAAALAAPTLTAAPPTSGPDSDDGMVEAWGAASDMPLSRESIGAGIIPLNIEREMWQSFAAVRRQRALRLIKAAAGLVRCCPCMLMASSLFKAIVPGKCHSTDTVAMCTSRVCW